MSPRSTLISRLRFAGLALALAAAPVHACTLRVRQHQDPAVLSRAASGELSGPQVELVREAARRMGCRVTVLPMPWARALLELQSGGLDVLPDAHRSPDREAYAWFSATTWPSNTRVFMRAEDLKHSTAPSGLPEFAQQGLRLGVQLGARYGSTIDQQLAAPALASRLVYAPSRAGLWQMLALGRVDGILADEGSGRRELPKLGLAQRIVASPVALQDQPLHMAFSRRTITADQVAKFDAAIETLRRDGTAASIERQFKPASPASDPRPL